MRSMLNLIIAAVLSAIAPTFAFAQSAEPWQTSLQNAASPVMQSVVSFHHLLLWVIFGISGFVLALLVYASWRFNEKRNPTPSRRSHNTVVEIAWTAVPVLILVIIAIPSFKLLYFMDVVPETKLTVKATGNQWYWSYEYPDSGNFTFDAYLVDEASLEPGQPRLLTTDNALVLPTETDIKMLVTAGDVLHSWAMPSLGVKFDAVPGKLREGWFRIDRPGVYYGQCSELCGVQHGFMPIMIRALPPADYEAWTKQAQEEFAKADGYDVAGTAPAATPAN